MIIHEGMEKSGNTLGFIPENGGIWEFHTKPPWKTLRFWAIFPGMGNLEFFPFFFFFFPG